ncbi:AAA family ATPase [Bacillus massilinigeriensis]|uniref:AAA family ATPase n=1 Tax=Bacillus mediterraneensis TaxID=1805474 RepID=UPI0008F7F0A2|nr:AAA family ATPase [Bacillus mediterraneensis]
MASKHRDSTDIQNKINSWKTELKQCGTISEEADLLLLIGETDREKQPQLLSSLLSLAATSRLNKRGIDAVAENWMQLATELGNVSIEIQEALAEQKWRSKADILSSLHFPPLRETDNRAAKQNTAEHFINICRTFLSKGNRHLHDLKACGSESEKNVRLISLLEKIIKETFVLLNASIEYEASISGVFHTSVHYEEMKKTLKELGKLKSEWKKEFEAVEIPLLEETGPLEELNKMIGLAAVKQRVNDHYKYLSYQKKRKDLGYRTKEALNLNMVITGNPGTGKTTIARLLAKIYKDLGVLSSSEVIETDRSQLVGAFVGQTEENVRCTVEKALGGVLFIDEAYSLKREGQSGNDYGQTAIDTLVSLMTSYEYGGKFAVILAGYTEEMRAFLHTNPGLRSRFPASSQIHLPDYTEEELVAIGLQIAEENDYVLTSKAREELKRRISREQVDETFGNARTVKNIINDAIFKKGSKAVQFSTIPSLSVLDAQDFTCALPTSVTSPKKELEALIGLHGVKEEVNNLIAFIRIQKFRRDQGFPEVPIQLHSVFSGNPGTGKTTVARIYAELLKEYGMLKRGHMVSASRADFVAGYVGQTAGKTRKKIREALGGVLFIDEAYSLLGESGGDYGKEVIETLVEEMTRHNENLVVILAGYPHEMDALLHSNPGLKSRFKKYFTFEDYTAEELFKIIETRASKYGYIVSSEAKTFLLQNLDRERNNGNGRYAVNILDEAIQKQAYRLIKEKWSENHGDDSSLLTEQDFHIAFKKLG